MAGTAEASEISTSAALPTGSARSRARSAVGLVAQLLGAIDPLADELTDQIFAAERGYADVEQDSHERVRVVVRDNLRTLLQALQENPV
ncbi:MAG: hypothetical protein HOV83_27465, partial [Catenulispora sp.]|nr:hypothetical protein [Catenulispora sp.]